MSVAPSTPSSPGMRFRSTIADGRTRRMLRSGTRLWPPARQRASPSNRASAATASSTLSTARYSKGAGFMKARPEGPARSASGDRPLLVHRPMVDEREPAAHDAVDEPQPDQAQRQPGEEE